MPASRPRLQLQGRPGELLDSGMRMCLLDVETSFHGLRTALEGVVGDAAAMLIYEAGYHAGVRYGEARLKQGGTTRDEAGFRRAIQEYTVGGFGAFEIRELEFAKGTAVVACRDPMAFEAYASLANGERRKEPVCDFSRGVIVGLLCDYSKRPSLGGLEETCAAAGSAECVFRIGEEEAMRRAAVARSLARTASKARA